MTIPIARRVRNLSEERSDREATTTRYGYRRVSMSFLDRVALHIENLEQALEHILRLEEEHDGEPFEVPMTHAEEIAREALAKGGAL